MSPTFLLIVGIPIAIVVATAIFIVALFFLPARFALLMAIATTVAGAIGLAVAGLAGLALAAAWLKVAPLDMTAAFALYTGLGAAGGIGAAAIAAWAVWRLARRGPEGR